MTKGYFSDGYDSLRDPDTEGYFYKIRVFFDGWTATLTDDFIVNHSDEHKKLKDMSDDEIIEALKMASRVAADLELIGYTVIR